MKSPALPLIAALASMALAAGCFGLPEGSADTGDQVTLRYTATDLGSGEVLADGETVTLRLGDGDSGLGRDLEAALRGRLPHENFTVESRGDPGRAFGPEMRVPRVLDPFPVRDEVDVEIFANLFGEPTVGQLFPLSFYQGEVESIENGTLRYRLIAEDGQRNAVPQVGSVLVTHVRGGFLERELEPEAGARFAVVPPSPFNPSTPLGLEPGSYLVVGADGDQMVLRHAPGQQAALVGRDLRFEVSVLGIVHGGAAVEPVEGNFAARRSPQLLGAPELDGAAAVPAPAEHASH